MDFLEILDLEPSVILVDTLRAAVALRFAKLTDCDHWCVLPLANNCQMPITSSPIPSGWGSAKPLGEKVALGGYLNLHKMHVDLVGKVKINGEMPSCITNILLQTVEVMFFSASER